MKRGSAAASSGASRATSAIIRGRSGVALMCPPASKMRSYCGSSRIRSISLSSFRPQAAKMSSSTRGYKKNVGPISKRNRPGLATVSIVADRPPTRWARSNTVTSAPARAKSMAEANPPGPAPITATRRLKARHPASRRQDMKTGESRA